MRIRSNIAQVCGAAIFAAIVFSTLPAAAATRTCVQDLYDFLNSSPPGYSRFVKMSINGMWPGDGSHSSDTYSYFGKGLLELGYNATYGGPILKSPSGDPNFNLYYDRTWTSAYWELSSQPFTIQAIPLDDRYPLKVYGNGATFTIYAQCNKAPFVTTGMVLTGFDLYGYFWSLSFGQSQYVVN